ncbi:MAG: L-aspartate oxidase, partial [Thermodesulfovibrionales bacterium]
LKEIRASLRRLMWEKVGIIRCGESLGIARERLNEWRYILDMDFNNREGLELKNMLTVANMITEAAIMRKGSVGAHYRSDFPSKEKEWKSHIRITKKDSCLELLRGD